jgi:hypothetical protein
MINSEEKTPLVRVLMKLQQEVIKMKEYHGKMQDTARYTHRLYIEIKETTKAMDLALGLKRLEP